MPKMFKIAEIRSRTREAAFKTPTTAEACEEQKPTIG